MKNILKSLLALVFCFSISCSRGGADDSAAGNNNGNGGAGAGGAAGQASGKVDLSGYKNVPGTILGQWGANNKVFVGVSQTSIKIAAECDNGTMNQLETKIKLSQSDVEFLENKKSGTGNCEIEFEKGKGFQYQIKGDQLIIDFGGQQGAFNRIEGGGGTVGAKTYTFFEGANCQGRTYTFAKGTDCKRLAGSTVSSINVNGKCQDFAGQAQDAGSVCQQINAQ